MRTFEKGTLETKVYQPQSILTVEEQAPTPLAKVKFYLYPLPSHPFLLGILLSL